MDNVHTKAIKGMLCGYEPFLVAFECRDGAGKEEMEPTCPNA